ncbi:MAG: hypothetical protein JWO31_682 [Phycisphaerales bacterium]|nr:hypothetical protein [Phycisphaerales bacterium]
MWRPAVWVAAAAQAALVLAGSRAVVPMLRAGVPVWVVVPIVAAVSGIAVLMLIQVVFQTSRPFVLRERPGRCRGFGYDLTGNASGACPECGRAA